MIRLILICLFVLIFGACQNNTDSNKQVISLNKTLKTEYNNVVFQRCVFLGFNKSEAIKNVLKMDRSTHQDFAYGLSEYRFIDSLVQDVILKAKKDSINHYHTYLESMNAVEQNELNGIPIFKYCLDYYSSEELDQLASKRIRRMESLKQ